MRLYSLNDLFDYLHCEAFLALGLLLFYSLRLLQFLVLAVARGRGCGFKNN
tara:strand:+ start:740 stop:892 length:153 start_codon:yes stop_codon:yes gene_type:complete